MALLQLFKTGKHIDTAGNVDEFTVDDMLELGTGYDPNLHEAPLVINHDESIENQGLIAKLIVINDAIFGIPHKVSDWLKEKVNSGRWPRISIALYGRDDPKNPTPGKLYLRHVSFVQVPAVKGMIPPQFADNYYYDLGEPLIMNDEMAIADLFSSLREFLISKYSLDDAELALPSDDIERLREMAVYEQIDEVIENMTENIPEATAAQQTYADAQVTIKELTEKIATLEAVGATKDFRTYLQSLSEQVLPAEYDDLCKMYGDLLKSDRALQYSDSDSLAIKFKKSLSNRPKAISLKATNFPAGDPEPSKTEDLSPVERARLITAKVEEARKNGLALSYSDAYGEVKRDLEKV